MQKVPDKTRKLRRQVSFEEAYERTGGEAVEEGMKELICETCGDPFTLRFGESEDETECLGCRNYKEEEQ